MSSYAYLDEKKTKIVYAEDCSADDCNKDFYCSTINCHAVVRLSAVGSDKRRPYFREKVIGSHIPECIPTASSYRPTDYDEDSFSLNLLIGKYLLPSSGKTSSTTGNRSIRGDGHKRPIESLLTLYYVLKSLTPSQHYNTYLVSDLLIDGRLRNFEIDKLCGVRLIECILMYYSKEEMRFYAKNAINSEINIMLQFSDQKLFEIFKNFYFNQRKKSITNQISVLIADWKAKELKGGKYLAGNIVKRSAMVVPKE